MISHLITLKNTPHQQHLQFQIRYKRRYYGTNIKIKLDCFNFVSFVYTYLFRVEYEASGDEDVYRSFIVYECVSVFLFTFYRISSSTNYFIHVYLLYFVLSFLSHASYCSIIVVARSILCNSSGVRP